MISFSARPGDIENAINVMRELDDQFKEKVTRRAVTNLLRRTQRAAKARAPKETGLLQKSIRVRVIKGKREKGLIYGRLGLDTGTVGTGPDGRKRRPSKYGPVIHQGRITSSGKHIPGKPFMKQAVETLGNDIGANELTKDLIAATENIVRTKSKRR